VEEVVEHLARYGTDAKILAGGQSLIPMMKLRLIRPALLIDINPLHSLNHVRLSSGYLAVGATARVRELESADVRNCCPLVSAAAAHVGHAPIRNRGTVCGSLAHADPAAELPLVAVCLDAEFEAQGPGGRRTIAAREFFRSYFTTALAAEEVLVEVRLRMMPPEAGWAFMELSKRAGDFALAAAAVILERGSSGTIRHARLALGAIADRPIRCWDAEKALVNQEATPDVFRAAAAAATDALDPPSDVHGSGKYRRHVARVLLERALLEAWSRAR
jgi:carbon-monoxide dehydrogenase medium subunit